MVNKKTGLIIGIIMALVIIGFFAGNYFIGIESFSVNPSLSLGVKMLLLEEKKEIVKITNNENTAQDFNVALNNFEGIGSINETSFTLGAKESREIEITFKDIKNKVNVYTGKLIIEITNLKKELPILLTVKNSNRIFTIDYDSIPKYSNVYPGGKLGVNVQISDMDGDNLREITINYFVKDFNNEIILSDEADLTIEGNKQIEKIIDIPETLAHGNYVFVSIINYNNIESTEGYVFSVTKKKTILAGTSDYFNLLVIVILILIVVILIAFIYFVKIRNDLLMKLKRQQIQEIRGRVSAIRNFKVKIRKLKISPKKKEQKIHALNIFKEKTVKKIREKHKRQRKIFVALKKKKKKGTIRRKLSAWRKEGFKKIGSIEETKVPKKKISKKVKTLGAKGYNIGFLKK